MASIQVRVAKDGTKSYRALVRRRGYPPQTATFVRKTDAKKWGQSIEASIEEGRYKNNVAAKKHTFAELVDRYIEVVLPRKPASAKDQKRQLLWWKDQLGDFRLSDLSTDLVQEGREKLAKRENRYGHSISSATINRYCAAVSHVFSIAIKEFKWLSESPMTGLGNLPEPKGRDNPLNDDDRERLLKACRESNSKYVYMIVVLALSTGARRSEILNLKWSDVDFERRVLIFRETKNKEIRTVPAAGHAYDLLVNHQSTKSNSSDYLFPSAKTGKPVEISKAWSKALADAGVDDFRFHDLRHSAASYLAMNGATLAEIAEVLGHKSYDMVRRYAHLTEPHTAGVVERMNAVIFVDEFS